MQVHMIPGGPGASGVLHLVTRLPGFAACRADPTRPPDMSDFVAVQEASLAIVGAVFAAHRLDAVIFPQMRDELPPLHSGDVIRETTVRDQHRQAAGRHGPGRHLCPGGRPSASSSWDCNGAKPRFSASPLPMNGRPAPDLSLA